MHTTPHGKTPVVVAPVRLTSVVARDVGVQQSHATASMGTCMSKQGEGKVHVKCGGGGGIDCTNPHSECMGVHADSLVSLLSPGCGKVVPGTSWGRERDTGC